MEDEIDLRKYVAVLVKHWKLIAIITGTAVIISALVSFLPPPVYEAKASVLMTKARPEIILEPKYQTVFQEDSTLIRQALLSLATSPSVANMVIEQMGDELEPSERKTSKLLAKIDIGNKGDLIKISAKSTNPQKAADIANTWAKSYKNYVNELYYKGMIRSPEELQAQANIAENEYEEKQKALEDFIKDNHVAELNQQINDKEILYDARLLREHVKSGSSSAASSTANSLALLLLQTRAFTSLPAGLQISLDSLSGSDVNLHDIDALISTLEIRSGGEKGQSLTELRQDILLLRAELEQEKAREREVEGARNIAWEAYRTIAGKSVETEVAAKAQAGIVEVAEIAAVPESPAASGNAMNIVIGLVLGLIVGVFAAFAVEYFKKE